MSVTGRPKAPSGPRPGALAAAARQLVGRVPPPLRSSLARLHRPLARHVAAAAYRRKYGAPFSVAISDEDDLFQFSLLLTAQDPAFGYYHGLRLYLEGGERNAAEIDEVLRDHGVSLRDAGSFLEFACGWGRVTRHFVHRVDPARVTVSDIDRAGVDFVRTELGVRGFYSTVTADELVHDGRYDVIAVVSLFSHLPLADWGPWLRRLGELLQPGGTLVLSTHGMEAFHAVPEADRGAFATSTEGFVYSAMNETRGRLSADHYGTAYVDEAFVARAAREHFPGELLGHRPRGLNGFQDLYVLRRTPAA